MEEANFDIYGDLDEALIEPLQEIKIKQQEAELAKIEEEKRTKDEIEELNIKLQKENDQLKINISLLLATASNEIERKDMRIRELRKELDDLIFRKTKVNNKKTFEKFTQTYPDKAVKENNHYSRDPIERLKIKKDSDLSRERRRSRERDERSDRPRNRRESPVKKTADRTNERRRERSSERSKRFNEIKPRSRHQSPEKSQKNRSSSKDHRTRSKSPRKDKNKPEKNDLRTKLLEKKSRVEITSIKNDGENVIVESKLIDEPGKNGIKHLDKNVNDAEIQTKESEIPDKIIIKKKKGESPRKSSKKDKAKKEDPPNDELKVNEIEQTPQTEVVPLIEPTSELIEEPKEILTIESTNDVVPDASNEVELYEEIPLENSEKTDEFPIMENDSHVKNELHLVPLEIGPAYDLKIKEDAAVLDLPLNNEEVLFDSRELVEKCPVKSPENESFDSTKENSGLNSLNTSGKSRKRKIVTTAVEDDGTVVFTIVRKKKRKN